jgi:hypothetical protein
MGSDLEDLSTGRARPDRSEARTLAVLGLGPASPDRGGSSTSPGKLRQPWRRSCPCRPCPCHRTWPTRCSRCTRAARGPGPSPGSRGRRRCWRHAGDRADDAAAGDHGRALAELVEHLLMLLLLLGLRPDDQQPEHSEDQQHHDGHRHGLHGFLASCGRRFGRPSCRIGAEKLWVSSTRPGEGQDVGRPGPRRQGPSGPRFRVAPLPSRSARSAGPPGSVRGHPSGHTGWPSARIRSRRARTWRA